MATINGTSGDEELDGTTSNDTINGLDGNDILYGDAGNDTLNGGNGVDDLEGGTGNDVLDGGADFDFASYILATSGVTVSLATTAAQNVGGGQGTDTLKNIEGLIGSSHDDTLTGNSGNNILDGFGGKDTLNGGAGDDILQISDTSTYVAGSKFDGGTGFDILSLNGDVDISGSTILNMEELNSEFSISLTSAQLLSFSNIETFQIDITTAGNVDLSAVTFTTPTFILGVGGITLNLSNPSTSSIEIGVIGSSGNDVVIGGLGTNSIVGNAGNDTLTGHDGADVIYGGTGNDTIHGGGGDDLLYGTDTAESSGSGNDTIYGEAGNDIIKTGDGTDTVSGGDGDDTITGGGTSVLNGDDGNDTIYGGSGTATLNGGAGNDVLLSGSGTNTINGGTGNDSIICAPGTVNTVDAGDGDDNVSIRLADITAGGGVNGGAGHDTLTISDGGTIDLASVVGATNFETYSGASTWLATVAILQTITLDGGSTLTINGAGGAIDWSGAAAIPGSITFNTTSGVTLNAAGYSHNNMTVAGSAYDDVVFGGDDPDTFHGNDGNDNLTGGAAADTLYGDAGNDLLSGAGGDDNLTGGDGNDTINGGDGNDYLSGNNGNDIVNGGAGNDHIFAELGDTVSGDAGDDLVEIVSVGTGGQLHGGAGNDTLQAQYDIDLSGDTVDGFETLYTINPSTVTMTVAQFNGFATIQGARTITLTTGGTIDLSSGSTNTIANTFNLANADTVFTLPVNAPPGVLLPYTVNGGSGNDTINGGNNYDTLYGGDGNNTIHGGGGNDNIYGGAGIDILDGGDGDDYLTILKPSDLTPGDQFIGGNGFDWIQLLGPNNSAYDIRGISMSGVEGVSAGTFGSVTMTSAQLNALQGITAQDVYLTTGGTIDLSNTDVSAYHFHLSDDGSTVTLGTGPQFHVNVWIIGGAGNDTITGNLSLSVTFSGGGGNDTLDLGPNGGGSLYGGDGNDLLSGGQYYNNLSGEAGDDILHVEHGATIIALGGSGNDSIYLGDTFNASSQVDGGADSDTVYLNGDFSAGLVFNATTMVNVENLVLSAGHSYNLTTANETVAVGQVLAVNGSALGASDTLTFSNAADTDGSVSITGGAGNDVLTGGAGADSFHLEHGGNDTVSGGGGNDAIYLGGTLTAADSIDGGGGSDTVYLDGNYSGGLVLGSATLVNVETLVLGTGHNYKLTSVDANVASGQTLSVDGSALGVGNALIFDGSAETNGVFHITTGAGNDTLTAGSGNDVLSSGAGNDSIHLEQGGNDSVTAGAGADTIYLGGALTSADSIDTGADTDHVMLDGDYSAGVTLGATTLVNAEFLTVAAGHNYKLTTNNTTVAAGQLLTVDASALGAGNSLNFNGAAEADGRFTITGGAGNDTLTGGAGLDIFHLENGGNDTVVAGADNDKIYLGAGFTAADSINGGAGSDYVYLDGDYSTALVLGATTLLNAEHLIMAAGHDYNLTTDNASVAGGQLLYVDASALGAGNSLTFNGSAEGNGRFTITGGAGNDTLTSGGGADIFHLEEGGNDTASGGGNSDKFYLGATLAGIDGGSGNDYVYLNGDYSGGATLNGIVNVEHLVVTAGHDYNLTASDAMVGSGQSFYVDASALGAGNSLAFNGAAESNGHFTITGGAGNDTLTGGAGNDVFHLEDGGNDTVSGGDGSDKLYLGGALTASDSIDGGDGSDYLYLNGDYSAGLVFGASTLTSIEHLTVTAGHNYNLTTNDATVGSGELLYVDGTALGAGNSLTFNGAAESNGRFTITGGAGNDTLTGGTGADMFHLERGGNDTVSGGDGIDKFYLGGTLTAADSIDGGASSSDWVYLDGNYAGGVTFGAATMINVEHLVLTAGHDYALTLNNANVAAGQLLAVDGSTLGATDSFTFNGAAESDGRFTIAGGAANDSLTGGAGNDTLTGGMGNDTLTGGAGGDKFLFTHGDGNDTITDFVAGNAGSDTINLAGYGVANFTALQALMTQSGADTIITFDASNHITLHNVTETDLNSGDFVFS